MVNSDLSLTIFQWNLVAFVPESFSIYKGGEHRVASRILVSITVINRLLYTRLS